MRKVRTPNERGTLEIKGGVSLWKVPQKITALILLKVRVKTGGKSARCMCSNRSCRGKPYLEQDKIGMFGVSFRFKHAGMSHR